MVKIIRQFGHNDMQFGKVSRGPPAGAGENRPDTVNMSKYMRGKKLKMGQTNAPGMLDTEASAKLGRRGVRKRSRWTKDRAKVTKKAQKRKSGYRDPPMQKLIDLSVKTEVEKYKMNGGVTKHEGHEGKSAHGEGSFIDYANHILGGR